MAQRVRRRLRVYLRHASRARTLTHIPLLWGEGRRRLRRGNWSKVLKGDGAVIAFVGPEATGKSTLVSACGGWLGDVFSTKLVHVGKPSSSLLTVPVNAVLPLARIVLPRMRTTRLEENSLLKRTEQSNTKIAGLASLIYELRVVILAWDRRQLLLKASRSAANGEIGILICDRYPSETLGATDSPRLRWNPMNSGLKAKIHNWLARIEHRLYREIPDPDIVLRLQLSIETAKKRNRERIKADKGGDPYMESRRAQNREWRRSGTIRVYDIDTEQPLPETVLNVKKAIWESL